MAWLLPSSVQARPIILHPGRPPATIRVCRPSAVGISREHCAIPGAMGAWPIWLLQCSLPGLLLLMRLGICVGGSRYPGRNVTGRSGAFISPELLMYEQRACGRKADATSAGGPFQQSHCDVVYVGGCCPSRHCNRKEVVRCRPASILQVP